MLNKKDFMQKFTKLAVPSLIEYIRPLWNYFIYFATYTVLSNKKYGFPCTILCLKYC